MDGTIDVVSEKGKGSVFTVTIPFGVPDKEVEAGQFADIRNDKILLIVDAAEKKEKKQQAFTDAGIACKVICQDEIQDTVRAENKDYSAILVTNENQPLEIIREIRQESLTDDILFACSINQVDKVDAAISAGADSILFQPVLKTTLFEELQRIRRKKSSRESDRKYLAGRNILVAEDRPINYMIIEYMLKEAGAAVEHAENGKAAVEMFRRSKQGQYDLILMDIMMPVMGGYEATSAIRHMDRPDAGNIPIIAMTANAFSEDIQKSRDMGMNSHISKPIDAAVVKKVLTTVLADASRFSA
jgi:CheY-like chemotaxis protein